MVHLCAACQRQVYPTEQLRALDQRFHRGCFRCKTCGLALTLRTFISCEGAPFCKAHAPHFRSSAIVDTPGMQVAAKSQQFVSQHNYQKDLDEMIRGRGLSVADDMETLRVKKMGEVISDVAYNGTLRRKKHMDEKRKTTELVKREPATSFGTTAFLYNALDGRPISLIDNTSGGHDAFREIGSISDFVPYCDEQPIHTLTRYVSGDSPHRWQNLIYHSNGSHQRGTGTNSVGSTPDPSETSPTPSRPSSVPVGRAFRAVYTYEAVDSDEVSFDEGDLLIGCTPLQSGWTTCTVQRTGRRGLAPGNYLEPV